MAIFLVPFEFLIKMVYSYNVINKKQTLNFVLLAVSACCNVIMNAMLIPIMGNIGAGIASLISYVLCGTMFVITFCKDTGTKIDKMVLVQGEDIEMLLSLIQKRK